MGGGLEFDLSHGAVAALWRSPASAAAGWRPVLQVADVRHVPNGSGLSPAPEQRYRVDLSDGVHSQPGTLAASLNLLVRDGALRRGSVVRVLHFVVDSISDRRRTIIILQLEILQTECTLIGSLKLYEPTRKPGGFTTRSTRYALRPVCGPYLGAQHIQQSCIASAAEKRANGLSYHGFCGVSNPAGGDMLCSSVAEKRANGLSYHGFCGVSNPAGGDMLCSDALLAEPAVWKMVGQIKDESLGYSDKPDFITVKATVSFLSTGRSYSDCPLLVHGKRCNVKATSNGDGMQRCEQSFGSCDYEIRHCKRSGHSIKSYDYVYFVHIQIRDQTGTALAKVYDEATKEIFGCTAKDLYLLKHEEQDYEQLDDIILGVEGKQYVLQLKVESTSLSNRRRVGCVVLKAEKVNPSAESHRLLAVIDAHLHEGLGSCPEFGNFMPTYSCLPDFKGRSTALSSNSSHANRHDHGSWLGSADRLDQQVNGYAVKPATLSGFGACGCGDHGPDIIGQRSSVADGFVDCVCSSQTSAHGAEWFPGKPQFPGA